MSLDAAMSDPPAQTDPSQETRDGTPADHTHAVRRDSRGWIYRLFAPAPDCRVLEIGDGHAGNWLSNVAKSDFAAPAHDEFDLVVMHYSLGRAATLDAAIDAAARRLRKGGLLVLAGENRLRPLGAARPTDAEPRRHTPRGYRSAMARNGLSNVTLYITHPPGNAPVYVVHADRVSARPFFRAALRSQRLMRWSPVRLVSLALIELNVMPFVQPGLLVVGEKC